MVGKTVQPNGDSGELITVSYFGGIAHPPGYPLYTILGFVFLKLPIPGEVAYRMNLMSTIFHIIALYFFYKSSLLISRNKYFLSIICTMILAFSYSFWLYSLVAEVFSLLDLFFCILLYLLLKLVFNRDKKKIVNLAMIWIFVFGLSLTNNQIIALILPVYVYVLVYKNRQLGIFPTLMGRLVIVLKLFFIGASGLIPYSYFFWVRNNVNPASWFYPSNVNDIFRHFLRLGYGQLLNYHDISFVDVELKNVLSNFLTYALTLFSEFWIFSILLPFSFVFMVFSKKRLLQKTVLLILFFEILLLLSMKFDVWIFALSIIERVFLNFNVLMIVFILMVLLFIDRAIARNLYKNLFYVVLTVSLVFMIFINYKRNSYVRNNDICKLYYQDMVSYPFSNKIILITGDVENFCFFYNHYVLFEHSSNNNVYISTNVFDYKNNGRFVKKEYGFDIGSSRGIEEFVQKNKRKGDIYLISTAIPTFSDFTPWGIIKRIKDKPKVDLEELYRLNKEWYAKSAVMNYYRPDYANAATQTIHEIYCHDYLNLAAFFYYKRSNVLFKKTFFDMGNYCSFNEFTAPSMISLYTTLERSLGKVH